MKNTPVPAAVNAVAPAKPFNVAELEPRRENVWIESPIPEPLPGAGDGPHA